jgi:hypothetical protein
MLKQAAAGAPASNQPSVTVSGGAIVVPGTVTTPGAAPAAPAPAAPVTFE